MAEKPKKVKKLKSINRSMFGYFCINSMVMLVIVVIVIMLSLVTGIVESGRQLVAREGEKIVNELNASPLPYDLVLDRIRSEGTRVIVFDEDGNRRYPEHEIETSDNLYNCIVEKLGNSEVGESEVFVEGDFANFIAVVRLDGRRCYLATSYSFAFFHKSVVRLQVSIWLVGIAMLILSLFLSYQFCKKITLGINTTSQTAVALAKGNYDVKFTNADYTELAALSDTLNYMRDEIKKSEDFQHEILANVTHDLKTPLTMIKAYASMIKEISGNDPEKRDKHLQVIIDEADRLTGLVNDVLAVSKIRSNMIDYNMKVFNLTELTYGIIDKFGYLQDTQGYNFMIDVDQNLYTRGDEEKIAQVLYNLLGNAANYTGDDKTVYISLKSNLDGSVARFTVRDTGKGIAKDEINEIWDRYYRVKENHVRPVKGTGLGLSIVKTILEGHSFRFGVESEVGKGSAFWIDFPEYHA